jgi:hypothetical protein
MGYGYRAGSIRTFWPDDTDTEIYISETCTLEQIRSWIADKWPGASMANISISSEHIHTDCLGYDCYDSGDYTTFIVIRRTPGA